MGEADLCSDLLVWANAVDKQESDALLYATGKPSESGSILGDCLRKAEAALTALTRENAALREALAEIAVGEGELQAIRDGGGGVMDALPRNLTAAELRDRARAALAQADTVGTGEG